MSTATTLDAACAATMAWMPEPVPMSSTTSCGPTWMCRAMNRLVP
jgi:hypothetical protein